jgi:hypothetical protein
LGQGVRPFAQPNVDMAHDALRAGLAASPVAQKLGLATAIASDADAVAAAGDVLLIVVDVLRPRGAFEGKARTSRAQVAVTSAVFLLRQMVCDGVLDEPVSRLFGGAEALAALNSSPRHAAYLVHNIARRVCVGELREWKDQLRQTSALANDDDSESESKRSAPVWL